MVTEDVGYRPQRTTQQSSTAQRRKQLENGKKKQEKDNHEVSDNSGSMRTLQHCEITQSRLNQR